MHVDPPTARALDPDWPHAELHGRVREALLAVPAYFKAETLIAGIMATDLHTLNDVLGATIEEQVVETLNAMRATWDPDERYGLYRFVRQPQTFPDVLLCRTTSAGRDILIGIELKGWYLLAKEGMPNFRFLATAAACNPQDFLMVVPWVLSQVISGRPLVVTPYIVSARHAAEYRNYHWQHVREAKTSTEITLPVDVRPYPSKSDRIDDEPAADKGKNFGRFARTGLMDDYLAETLDRPLCGIRVRHWLAFFKAFQENADEGRIRKALDALAAQVAAESPGASGIPEALDAILNGLRRLLLPDHDGR